MSYAVTGIGTLNPILKRLKIIITHSFVTGWKTINNIMVNNQFKFSLTFISLILLTLFMDDVIVISYKKKEDIYLNEPDKIVLLLKCSDCVVAGVVKELWLIESQMMLVQAVHAEHIRLTSYPPFYKILNKYRRRKWREINGSNFNAILDCVIESHDVGIMVNDYNSFIMGNMIV